MNGVQGSGLAHDAHRLAVGIACESAGVFQQGAEALFLLHFVEHGALYLAGDVDQTLVTAHDDDIVVGQFDVARSAAVKDVVVDVDGRDESVVAVYLDVTQRTDVVDTTGHVQGIEYCCKGAEGIGARSVHLAHDVDQYRARLSYGELNLTALVAGAKL